MDAKVFDDLLTHAVGLATAIVGLASAVVAVTKYFNYRSERDKIRAIGEAFESVVASLRSDNAVERMAGAVRLRRFYDPKLEMGTGRDAPFAKVAVDVAVAILRGQPTSDFQKLLADGLGFAGNLQRADLQRTNLQFAYLGARRKDMREELITDLSYADFYRADLSRASLKKANASHAVFYQARLHSTVLKGANLASANFFDADLSGAVFDGASLLDADFSCAREVPPGIKEHLNDKGIYTSSAPFEPPANAIQASELSVFVSKPGCLTPLQKVRLETIMAKLRANGLVPKTLERAEYPQFGAIGEVRRLLWGCEGALIFGFPELRVAAGTWRAGTPEEAKVEGLALPTAWVQIEAGMAAMAGLPVFVVHEDKLGAGVFDLSLSETGFYHARLEDDWEGSTSANAFSNWIADVRESAQPTSRSQPRSALINTQ